MDHGEMVYIYEWLLRTEMTLYCGENGARRQQQLRCEGGGASELSIQPSAVCHCDRHSDKNGERRIAMGAAV